MAKRALLMMFVAAAACGSVASHASGDGFGVTGSAAGVSVAGSPYRYVALSPSSAPRVTVVERIKRDGGKIDRWWYLPGNYYVPAVAYDGSGGGLSADGRTLVLTEFSRAYPPQRTRLAVLDTDVYLRHPRRPGQSRPAHAIRRLRLHGSFSFDAISPDGSTIYLIHNLLSRGRPSGYEVRALDSADGRLLPRPIVDPDEPDEQMQGLPITRANSGDGRWAYTLYDGNGGVPFIHALDTVRGRAVCVDLPQLRDRRNAFLLRMRLADGGNEIEVFNSPTVQGAAPSPPLLSVDTKTFAVHKPSPPATASSEGPAWLPIGIAAAILAAALIWILGRRRLDDSIVRLGREVSED
ncbi:MAG TPA: hypothetical protein VH275_04330 [Solirubrobacterales bacterium]|jgi:hypothetical protein|nr:hypothetical protein [Solirubrobacterales bacterium]